MGIFDGLLLRCAAQRRSVLAAGLAGIREDDHRLADVRIFDPVALVGDLLDAAGHLPDVRPEVVELHLVELFVVIALRRNALGVVHRERHGPQACIG